MSRHVSFPSASAPPVEGCLVAEPGLAEMMPSAPGLEARDTEQSATVDQVVAHQDSELGAGESRAVDVAPGRKRAAAVSPQRRHLIMSTIQRNWR